jgi:hypothetical protein
MHKNVCVLSIFVRRLGQPVTRRMLPSYITCTCTLTQPANSLNLLIAILNARQKFQCHQTFLSFCNAALFRDMNFCPILISRQNLSLFLVFVLFISLAAGNCCKFALSAELHFQQLMDTFWKWRWCSLQLLQSSRHFVLYPVSVRPFHLLTALCVNNGSRLYASSMN